jgi:hypothetical protein
MSETSGRCLCGGVTFAYEGPELWRGYCHCGSCRRNTASPVTAFLGVPADKARLEGETLAVYVSSPGVRRSFCSRCGTPMAYESENEPGEIHFYAATLDAPQDYVPAFHVHVGEKLPWFEVADDLPRHRASSTGPKIEEDG